MSANFTEKTDEQLDEEWKRLMGSFIVEEHAKAHPPPEPVCCCTNGGKPWVDPATGARFVSHNAGCVIHGIRSNIVRRCINDDKF